MRRILFCPPLYAPGRGGSQRLFADLARLWAAGGGSSVVYTTGPAAAAPGGLQGSAGSEGGSIRVRRFPARQAAAPAWRGRLLAAAARLGPASWRAALGFPHFLTRGYRPWLRRRAAEADGPFDLVVTGALPHVHFIEPAARFARRTRIPWVAIPLAHTGLLPVHGPDRVLGPGRGAVLRSARRVVALTEAEIPLLIGLGVPEARLAVLPAALTRPDPPGSPAAGAGRAGLAGRYVLQAGALGADKGTLTLLRAHALRAKAGRDDGLVLAGASDTAVRQALERLPAEAACRTRLVESPADTPWHDLMAGAAVLAQPSRADSFGLAVLEAWRAGVPVVVADAGGLPRLVRAEIDGLVVPPDNPPALAAALDRLQDEPGLASRLGTAGRQRLRDTLTWERAYPAWHRLLEAAMARSAGEAAA